MSDGLYAGQVDRSLVIHQRRQARPASLPSGRDLDSTSSCFFWPGLVNFPSFFLASKALPLDQMGEKGNALIKKKMQKNANDFSQARFSESPTSRHFLIPESFSLSNLKSYVSKAAKPLVDDSDGKSTGFRID